MASQTSWMINHAKLNDYILQIRVWRNKRQQSVNNIWFCIIGNLSYELLHTVINGVLAGFIGKKVSGTFTAPFSKCGSTERQRYLAMHPGLSEWQCLAIIHILCTGCLFSQNSAGYLRYPIMTISVNRASTIFDLGRQVIKMSFSSSQVEYRYCQPLLAKEEGARSLPHSENERQQSVNDFLSCKSGNWKLICSLLRITDLLEAVLVKKGCDTVTSPFWKVCYPIMKMSVNEVSTICGLAHWVIMASWGYRSLYQMYRPPYKQKYKM